MELSREFIMAPKTIKITSNNHIIGHTVLEITQEDIDFHGHITEADIREFVSEEAIEWAMENGYCYEDNVDWVIL